MSGNRNNVQEIGIMHMTLGELETLRTRATKAKELEDEAWLFDALIMLIDYAIDLKQKLGEIPTPE